MKYINYYSSPLGKLLMAADDIGLTGLWFENQLHYAYNLDPEHQEKELPVFNQTKQWLDLYFSGQKPDFTPPIHMTGTPFQTAVWNILEQIPYGQTNDLRRHRSSNRQPKRYCTYVSTSCRASRWA